MLLDWQKCESIFVRRIVCVSSTILPSAVFLCYFPIPCLGRPQVIRVTRKFRFSNISIYRGVVKLLKKIRQQLQTYPPFSITMIFTHIYCYIKVIPFDINEIQFTKGIRVVPMFPKSSTRGRVDTF